MRALFSAFPIWLTFNYQLDMLRYCEEWSSKPPSYFEKLDLIIDNKKWEIPTTARARKYLNQQRVRFHIRTPAEGSMPQYTKPNRKKNRLNTGAAANVCAGVSKGRIVLWEYLPEKWNGQAAADLYKHVIKKTLKRMHGQKRTYVVFEDNDPTGYKSSKATTLRHPRL